MKVDQPTVYGLVRLHGCTGWPGSMLVKKAHGSSWILELNKRSSLNVNHSSVNLNLKCVWPRLNFFMEVIIWKRKIISILTYRSCNFHSSPHYCWLHFFNLNTCTIVLVLNHYWTIQNFRHKFWQRSDYFLYCLLYKTILIYIG